MSTLSSEEKYHLLLETLQKARNTLDLNETLKTLVDYVETVIDFDAAGIFVLNEEIPLNQSDKTKQMIVGMTQRGFDGLPIEDDLMLMRGKGIVGYVISSGKSVIIPDVSKDKRYVEGRKRTKSEITVPIKSSGRTIGAINLENDNFSAFDYKDLEILEFFTDAAAISIEKSILHQQLLERELIKKQLQLAREVQYSLFPINPPNIPGYEIAGVCLPAEEVGGDYYDFIELPKKGFGIVVADVSGHGIPSALMMTAFRAMLRINIQNPVGLDRIATLINQQIPEITGDTHFITAFYIELDNKNDEIAYFSCGHQPGLLFHIDGSCDLLDARGPVLGVFETATYPVRKLTLTEGDTLLIYTDGVIEIINRFGKEFGINRLRKLIEENRLLSSKALIQLIIDETSKFSDFGRINDDFTLVAIKKLEGESKFVSRFQHQN